MAPSHSPPIPPMRSALAVLCDAELLVTAADPPKTPRLSMPISPGFSRLPNQRSRLDSV